ncbi:hypothetical protein [uncultured Sphingomonas sp.]|uniref:hypothetical protein n=1 Tax=uncultured Sphingomonas sp. TaxID=158754 RepID=UPI0035C97A4F
MVRSIVSTMTTIIVLYPAACHARAWWMLCGRILPPRASITKTHSLSPARTSGVASHKAGTRWATFPPSRTARHRAAMREFLMRSIIIARPCDPRPRQRNGLSRLPEGKSGRYFDFAGSSLCRR